MALILCNIRFYYVPRNNYAYCCVAGKASTNDSALYFPFTL